MTQITVIIANANSDFHKIIDAVYRELSNVLPGLPVIRYHNTQSMRKMIDPANRYTLDVVEGFTNAASCESYALTMYRLLKIEGHADKRLVLICSQPVVLSSDMFNVYDLRAAIRLADKRVQLPIAVRDLFTFISKN